jgi:GT2 family glycosyltransferase
MEPDTIGCLLDFGNRHPEVAVWSATANDELRSCAAESVAGCDFSCFMLRRKTIEQHGWFDREYKPAYFEDNDYVTRVILGGGQVAKVVRARHQHDRSITIREDREMAHHVNHWFGHNRGRFLAKWRNLTDDYCQIPKACHASPFNTGRALHWWPEQDRNGYNVAGGIHD